MNIKLIKSVNEHHSALAKAEMLAISDPEKGSFEHDQLELLTLLIEDFERTHYKFDAPDPISAIEFRMEEQGLRQRDLIPLLGSKSRVSEVLARKRPLTIPMIRSLNESLGIPTHVLLKPSLQAESFGYNEPKATDWSYFPIKEMQKRGWINYSEPDHARNPEYIVKDFLELVGRTTDSVPFYRQTLKGLGYSSLDIKAQYSCIAWSTRVLHRAKHEINTTSIFNLKCLSDKFLRDLAKLSRFSDGPLRAISQLNNIGIRVIIEPKLPNSLIDGAAMLTNDLQPVIGLTLRNDRIDYFWFTLLHELAHVWKHLNTADETFIDRIDADNEGRIESEANRIAQEALIPRTTWKSSPARLQPNLKNIINFADSIEVHPAIVAGRIQHESGKYNQFRSVLGQNTVRKLFNEINFI